jgi:hypothetical protein
VTDLAALGAAGPVAAAAADGGVIRVVVALVAARSAAAIETCAVALDAVAKGVGVALEVIRAGERQCMTAGAVTLTARHDDPHHHSTTRKKNKTSHFHNDLLGPGVRRDP